MKYIGFILFLTTVFSTYSQSYKDYLVTKELDTLNCKVIGLKGKRIEYILEGKESPKKKNIFKFTDVKITDIDVIDNPTKMAIEKPETGYAHIYFYRPYVYTGSALACVVNYNGEKFINVKTKSYFVHKVKAGEIHSYNWSLDKKNKIVIKPSNGEIYYIRASFAADFEHWDPVNTNTSWDSNSSFSSTTQFGNTSNIPGNSFSVFGVQNKINIFIDNPNIAEYIVLTMKKESIKY